MQKVTEATITVQVHNGFASYASCTNHTKTGIVVTELGRGDLSLARYTDMLSKCKSQKQWQAKAHGRQVPAEAVLAIRTTQDVFRLLFVAYMYQAEAGTPLSGGLQPRGHFIDPELENFMSQ